MPWYRFERKERSLVAPLRAAADAITARMSAPETSTPAARPVLVAA